MSEEKLLVEIIKKLDEVLYALKKINKNIEEIKEEGINYV